MAEKKAKQKPRHVRHANARALRRSLAAITPETSHPQKQCPLFSALPSEIRNLIFQYAVCQQYDYSQPASKEPTTYRLCQEYETKISTELLRTCRLIYYETRNIPIMSTTHHISFYTTFNQPRSLFYHLHHLSGQIGRHLYHLHLILDMNGLPSSLRRFIHGQRHLQWKKITWTIRTNYWRRWYLLEPPSNLDLPGQLRSLVLPSACQQVVLELEALADKQHQAQLIGNFAIPPTRPQRELIQQRFAPACQEVSLRRADESIMYFNRDLSREYQWVGTAKNFSEDPYLQKDIPVPVIYYVNRLCWKPSESGNMREYERYDSLDCLNSPLVQPATAPQKHRVRRF